VFVLKEYQSAALNALREYLQVAHSEGDPDPAFYKVTRRPYEPVPGLRGAPYVCLRLPTGGGKTLLAAHAIEVVTREWLKTEHSMVLWLVPGNAIREQTLTALRDRQHPYRQALDDAFGGNVEVFDIDEALNITRASLDGATCVVVATLAALRREDPSGLRVYRENGSLMSHFTGLTQAQEKLIDRSADVSRMSLANVLRLRRPIVIVDEAHNNRTPLSFDTLSRFSPSAILELTATPQQSTKGENRASNVLYHVAATELKKEGMLKLPVKLLNIPEAGRALAQAVDWQQSLENVAKLEEQAKGDYIRPIVLIQAQSKSKGQERLTPDVVKKMLIEDCKVPEEQIAIATGSERGIDGVDVAAKDCPLRFIITVQALAEGWDCPFAYVLCSLAESTSTKAVEQILGRVLRMPYAKRRAHDSLNCAYAVVTTESFNDAATGLRDSLIENGFEQFEAERLITKAQGTSLFDEVSFKVSEEPRFDELPPEYAERVTFDSVSKTVVVSGVVNRRFQHAVESVLASDQDRGEFVRQLERPRREWQQAEAPADRGEEFAVPVLAIRQGDFLEALEETHFRDFDWTLQGRDATLSDDLYNRSEVRERAALLDVSDTGHVQIKATDRLARDLAHWQSDTGWTQAQLVRWLTESVDHPDQPHMAMANYLSTVVDGLIRDKGFTVDELVRDRHRLRDACGRKYERVRQQAVADNAQAILFGQQRTLEVSPEAVFEFIAEKYAPDTAYTGPFQFNKHFFAVKGDMNGEEADCAMLIDSLECVRYWVRNVERKPWSFKLPRETTMQSFYPDFVALLNDGRVLVVEYKGEHLRTADEAEEKARIGKLYEELSRGAALFRMVGKDDYQSALNAICD
jgi:type III restriction enzyme